MLDLFYFTRQLPPTCSLIVFPRTLSDVFKFEAFFNVLLMLETLSPVPGHTLDSLGGTSATFMVEA